MNAMLRIQVRIAAQQAAAQLGQITAALKAMQNQATATAAATRTIASSTSSLAAASTAAAKAGEKVNRSFAGGKSLLQIGKSIQSAGRQLTYNFTYPLEQAGKAALGFAMDNEAAFTRLQKVYGDGTRSAAELNVELGKLRLGFRKLSDIYGIAQSEVIGIGEAWAAAGAEGFALAKATEATIQAMLLGDFKSYEDAVTSLISIQTAYTLGAEDLQKALFDLNAIENQTSATFQDLVTGIVRTGSTAQASGVSIRELGAMIAALVPSTGSASTAGNGLRTIISRIMAPTAQAIGAFHELGIEFESASFQGQNATQRLETLSKAFLGLNDAQKVLVGTQIAGRFQVNRFLELMKQIQDPVSQYNRALEATSSTEKSQATAMREINTILASSPKAYEILQTRLHNLMVDAITPLIPAFLQLFSLIDKAAAKFADLDPNTQTWILLGAVVLAVIGPITRLTGAFVELFAILKVVPVALFEVGKFLVTNPYVLLVAAIIAAIVAFALFHDQIIGFVEDMWAKVAPVFQRIRDVIVGAFNSLPAAVRNAFIAVIHIIQRAIEIIAELLSYLNPFAHHSPSLVESVDAGVDYIAKRYASLANVGQAFRQAAADFKAFSDATAGASAGFAGADRAEQRQQIVSAAPGAGAATDAMYASVDNLRGVMAQLTDEYAKQKSVLDALEPDLRAAKDAYDAQNAALDKLQANLDATSQQLQDAKDQLDYYASAPLAGTKAWTDALFANEQEQKKLQLQIMQLEDAGGTYEDLQQKIANINGEIETLRGKQEDLRQAGAGSDILGFYDDQIKALEQQAGAAEGATAPLRDLQDQLDALQRKAQEMDLQKDLELDPLRKQIEDLVDTSKELTFQEIIDGINAAKPLVDTLTAKYDEQKKAVEDQQATVDLYKAHLDELQATYDVEKQKLDDLGDAYDATEAQVRLLETALSDLASAYKAAQDASSGGAGAGGGGGLPGGGDFAGGGGAGLPGEGDLDSWLADLDKQFKESFGNFDIFGPVRDAWDGFVAWWNATVVPAWQGLVGAITFEGWDIDLSGVAQTVSDGFGVVIGGIQDNAAWPALVDFFNSLDLGKWATDLWQGIVDIGDRIGEEVSQWGDLLDPFLQVLDHLRQALFELGQIVGLALAPVIFAFQSAWEFIKAITKPFLDVIGEEIGAALQIIHDIVKFFLDLLAGNWGKAWDDLKDLVGNTFVNIVKILKAQAKLFLAAGKEIFRQLWRGMTALWDLIYGWLDSLGQAMIDAFVGFFVGLYQAGADMFKQLWDGLKLGWDLLMGWIDGLGQLLVDYFNTANQWLIDAGKAVLQGLWDGMVAIWDALWAFFFGDSIKTWVVDYFKDALTWLIDAGKAIIQGLWDGVQAIWDQLWAWIGNIKDWILEKFQQADVWLYEIGKSIIQGAWNGIKEIWNQVSSWFGSVKDWVKEKFEAADVWLYSIGKDILQGLWDGVRWVWDEFWSWIGNFGQWIKDKIPNPLGMLYDIGKSIMQGLWDGMQNVWDKVTGWLSNLNPVSWFNDIAPKPGHAGDNLVPIGKMVMNGLLTGMQAGWGDVASYLSSINPQVHMQATGTANAGLAGGGGAGTRVVNINGDLSFPNITSPDDAEAFIRNLETLAA